MLTTQLIQEARATIHAKVASAIQRLVNAAPQFTDYGPMCIGHSGGKDSVVNHFLVTQVFPDLPVVHTAKPGGDNAIHPDTLMFLYQRPYAIEFWPRALGHNPKYAVQFDGSRVSEQNRTDRSADFIQDGQPVNRKHLTLVVPNSMFGMTFVFPFYDWTDADVWACIYEFGLPYSPEYVEETQMLSELTA